MQLLIGASYADGVKKPITLAVFPEGPEANWSEAY